MHQPTLPYGGSSHGAASQHVAPSAPVGPFAPEPFTVHGPPHHHHPSAPPPQHPQSAPPPFVYDYAVAAAHYPPYQQQQHQHHLPGGGTMLHPSPPAAHYYHPATDGPLVPAAHFYHPAPMPAPPGMVSPQYAFAAVQPPYPHQAYAPAHPNPSSSSPHGAVFMADFSAPPGPPTFFAPNVMPAALIQPQPFPSGPHPLAGGAPSSTGTSYGVGGGMLVAAFPDGSAPASVPVFTAADAGYGSSNPSLPDSRSASNYSSSRRPQALGGSTPQSVFVPPPLAAHVWLPPTIIEGRPPFPPQYGSVAGGRGGATPSPGGSTSSLPPAAIDAVLNSRPSVQGRGHIAIGKKNPSTNFDVFDSTMTLHYSVPAQDVLPTRAAQKYRELHEQFGYQTRFKFLLCRRHLQGRCAEAAECSFIHCAALPEPTYLHLNFFNPDGSPNVMLARELMKVPKSGSAAAPTPLEQTRSPPSTVVAPSDAPPIASLYSPPPLVGCDDEAGMSDDATAPGGSRTDPSAAPPLSLSSLFDGRAADYTMAASSTASPPPTDGNMVGAAQSASDPKLPPPPPLLSSGAVTATTSDPGGGDAVTARARANSVEEGNSTNPSAADGARDEKLTTATAMGGGSDGLVLLLPQYECLPPGTTMQVYNPNATSGPPQPIDSSMILRTVGAEVALVIQQQHGSGGRHRGGRGGAATPTSALSSVSPPAPSTTAPQPTAAQTMAAINPAVSPALMASIGQKPKHCAHFQFKKICNLGRSCQFIHSKIALVDSSRRSSKSRGGSAGRPNGAAVSDSSLGGW